MSNISNKPPKSPSSVSFRQVFELNAKWLSQAQHQDLWCRDQIKHIRREGQADLEERDVILEKIAHYSLARQRGHLYEGEGEGLDNLLAKARHELSVNEGRIAKRQEQVKGLKRGKENRAKQLKAIRQLTKKLELHKEEIDALLDEHRTDQDLDTGMDAFTTSTATSPEPSTLKCQPQMSQNSSQTAITCTPIKVPVIEIMTSNPFPPEVNKAKLSDPGDQLQTPTSLPRSLGTQSQTASGRGQRGSRVSQVSK